MPSFQFLPLVDLITSVAFIILPATIDYGKERSREFFKTPHKWRAFW